MGSFLQLWAPLGSVFWSVFENRLYSKQRFFDASKFWRSWGSKSDHALSFCQIFIIKWPPKMPGFVVHLKDEILFQPKECILRKNSAGRMPLFLFKSFPLWNFRQALDRLYRGHTLYVYIYICSCVSLRPLFRVSCVNMRPPKGRFVAPAFWDHCFCSVKWFSWHGFSSAVFFAILEVIFGVFCGSEIFVIFSSLASRVLTAHSKR